jgi:hypothetical protein
MASLLTHRFGLSSVEVWVTSSTVWEFILSNTKCKRSVIFHSQSTYFALDKLLSPVYSQVCKDPAATKRPAHNIYNQALPWDGATAAAFTHIKGALATATTTLKGPSHVDSQSNVL